ncbi:MAG: hypothetical protein N2327_07135 [Caldimicrobium sp.]|nr:hypothetical protein [Caldimicrobium sp.]
MAQPTFPFDRTLREVLQRLPLKIIQILFGSKVSEVLESTFPTTKERKADFVGRLENGTLIHLEIQSAYDPTLPLRLIELYLRIYERYGAYPLQVLLWVGDKKCPYRTRYRLGRLEHQVKVVEMRKISCRELLESEVEEDQLLAILCKKERDFWDRLRERVERLEEGRRRDFLMKLLVLARLRKDAYNEVVRLYEEVTKMPLVIDKSRDPFYLEGIQQGLQQGLLREAQEMVLEVVEVKLGRVPKGLEEQIKAETDRDKLKRLLKELVLTSNPMEVIQQFGYRVNET